jgi:hypothetical protein
VSLIWRPLSGSGGFGRGILFQVSIGCSVNPASLAVPFESYINAALWRLVCFALGAKFKFVHYF